MQHDALHLESVASPHNSLQKSLDEKLLDAATAGSTASVAVLLKAGAAVCATCGECVTLLCAAAGVVLSACALTDKGVLYSSCHLVMSAAWHHVLQRLAQPLWQFSAAAIGC
jgi:hypothetical protein